ncbi:MAG: hypothetical protein BA870_03860 [Desulfuromonadales bacterium C00003094]|nr:MAG: hypothetical protein BA870_03860 [Desulfuromonadales bacterium C00003094]
MWKVVVGGILYLLLGLSGCVRAPLPVVVLDPRLSQFVAVESGRLQSTELVEASGLATSRRRSDLLWAVNDSGNRSALYALAVDGRELGQVILAGVDNDDWEDLVAFTWRGKPWLLVADVGDNRGQRDRVVLHALPEPQADDQGRFSGEVQPAWSLTFTYPDGPHDCEAVAVDETAARILLLSKRSNPPMLYSLPLGPPPGVQLQMATVIGPVATIPPPSSFDLLLPYGQFRSQPTAMDLSTDSRDLLILTYRHAYLYQRSHGQEWAAAVAKQPQTIVLPDLFTLVQREAACFSGDGRNLFVTGEGAGAALLHFNRQ